MRGGTNEKGQVRRRSVRLHLVAIRKGRSEGDPSGYNKLTVTEDSLVSHIYIYIYIYTYIDIYVRIRQKSLSRHSQTVTMSEIERAVQESLLCHQIVCTFGQSISVMLV